MKVTEKKSTPQAKTSAVDLAVSELNSFDVTEEEYHTRSSYHQQQIYKKFSSSAGYDLGPVHGKSRRHY